MILYFMPSNHESEDFFFVKNQDAFSIQAEPGSVVSISLDGHCFRINVLKFRARWIEPMDNSLTICHRGR